MHSIGCTLFEVGDFTGAIGYLENAIATLERAGCAPSHKTLVECRLSLSFTLHTRERAQDDEKRRRERDRRDEAEEDNHNDDDDDDDNDDGSSDGGEDDDDDDIDRFIDDILREYNEESAEERNGFACWCCW
jgi:hypothetical protein